MVLNAFTTLALAGAALATSCAIEVSSGMASPSAAELKGLLMSTMTLPARASPYWATTGTTLAYPRAAMTMSPAGTAPNSPAVASAESLGEVSGLGLIAADDLDGVAACYRQRGDGAGHVAGADDADAAHELSYLDWISKRLVPPPDARVGDVSTNREAWRLMESDRTAEPP